ncbi:MAG: AbrB/MazE/SpoVT family DNA-binding domain-containing protein [Deltaproteobacteria bacterium]|jgi:antitoxin PrlF|nr:AbrB/MazE/SpoVT family DNA-binding domain-containing protein [Deltaproteobacteria bacterium]MBT4527848.1 AbrB/MazE/SpoVT family DNA-binding domain-containing protein [Deltaproteobacteria bacterium]
MISTITSKGQVTIPKEIRSFLGIKPSDKINFTVEKGNVVLKPVRTLKDFRGSVLVQNKSDINKERAQAKKTLGERIHEEME